jgi:hypothetical protein
MNTHPAVRFRHLVAAAGVLVLALSAVGCSGSNVVPCTPGGGDAGAGASGVCPSIAGMWNMDVTYYTTTPATGGCAWFNSTGTTPMIISQPGGGPDVTVTVQDEVLSGTVPQMISVVATGKLTASCGSQCVGSVTASAPLSLTSYGQITIQRSDSITLRFTDATDFTGTWSTTEQQMQSGGSNSTPKNCSRSDDLSGNLP